VYPAARGLQRLMWQFTSDYESDHHSTLNLEKEEVIAGILATTIGVTLDFMGEGGPLPFNQARLSDLVSLPFPSPFFEAFSLLETDR
jgi:hypothetical protein